MAVAYDNTVNISGKAVVTLTTGSFTISSSANRAAYLVLGFLNNTMTSITASVGGTSCSAITSGDSGTSNTPRVIAYGCAAPGTGSQTATASWTTSATECSLGVITATGVDQTTPFNGGSAARGSATRTITSTSGDLTTTGIFNTKLTNLTTNQTQKYNADITAGTACYAGDIGPGTGTTTHTWSGAAGGSATSITGANFKQVASADVTVALTGVGLAAAVGTMALAMTFGLTGNGLAAGVGTVGLSHTQSLTGVGLSAAVGTIVPNWDLSLALTGNSLAAAVGTVTPAFTLPLTGPSSAALAVGTLAPAFDLPLTNVFSEAGIGSLGLEFTLPLSGVGLEAAVGTLIAEQGTANLTLALTGLFSEASVGSLVADRALPFTGVGLEAVIGNLTPGLSFALTGVSLDAATGNLVADRTLTITGTQLEAAVGTITSVQGLLLALTGVYSELSVGSVAASGGTLTGGARLYVRVIRGDRPGGEEDWMVSWNG